MSELYHYGVLGMRWGVTTGGKSGSGSSGGKKQSLRSRLSAHYARSKKQKYGVSSEDHKASRKIKRKRLHEMSNDELKLLTTRLQLERNYRSLTPSATRAGSQWVSDVISESGKQVAKQYVTSAMGTAAEEVIKKFPQK